MKRFNPYRPGLNPVKKKKMWINTITFISILLIAFNNKLSFIFINTAQNFRFFYQYYF